MDVAATQIAARFAAVGRRVAPWPVRPGASAAEIEQVEAHLMCRLPGSFRSLIQEFDFLNCVAGNVALTLADSVDGWLVAPNVRSPDSIRLTWWGAGPRPPELLLVASSDAHTFLLGLATGEIVCLREDDASRTPVRVATTFEEFYRGLASIYLAGLGTDAALHEAERVQVLADADPGYDFWRRFAQHAA